MSDDPKTHAIRSSSPHEKSPYSSLVALSVEPASSVGAISRTSLPGHALPVATNGTEDSPRSPKTLAFPVAPINPADRPSVDFLKTRTGEMVEQRRRVDLTQSFRRGIPPRKRW